MLLPKNRKYRKAFKGRVRPEATSRGTRLAFGEFGLKAAEAGRLTSQQLEAARRAIVRKIKRLGQMWLRVFPSIPVSAKPAEVRMGKGKGAISFWACRVPKNRVIFEVKGIPLELAKRALQLGNAKLPIATVFIKKETT